MAERLHPGVYVEERRRGLTAIQGVSTSNYGTVGFTPKGPTNVATLATSFDQAERTFGSFTEKGQVMTQVFAFFANNGVRAYIVRVVASDAVKALSPATTATNPRVGSAIGNPISEEEVDTGDGSTKAVSGTLAEVPCRPGSVSITYKEAGTTIIDSGSHTGVDNAAALTDATKSWTVDEHVGKEIRNLTDGSSGTITANTSDTITATLAGGTEDDWDTNDLYEIVNGAHTGANNAAILTDSTKSWTVDEHVGKIVRNLTDGSYGTITANTANTITATLAGGTDDDWDTDDVYEIAYNTSVSPTPDGAYTSFIGKISGTLPIVPGTVQLTTIVGGVDVQYTDPAKDGLLKDSAGNVRGYIDYDVGNFSLSVATGQEPDAASLVTAIYTAVSTERTVTDDGDGALEGDTLDVDGTINYATGAVAFTVGAAFSAPHDQNSILAEYIQNAFDVDPISEGEWGDDLQIQVRGNEDYFDRDLADYSKHDVLVVLDGTIEEIFDAVQFTDPTASDYVITIMNEANTGSKLVEIGDPSNDDNKPDNLDGKQRSRAVAAGNGTATEFGSTGTADPDGYPDIPVGIRSVALETPVQPTSISITYTDLNGVARTITDDGDGNLIGDIDPLAAVGFNQVDYDTGKFAFKTVAAVSEAETSHATPPTGNVPGALVSIQHYLEPGVTINTDEFTGGSDGVASIGRNELTDPTLKTDREGMYALLTTDELLNVAIPDAAGDVTMSTDQVTEAESNGKWFIILASPPGMSPQQVKDWRRNTLGISSSYAALYYPYITITDPVTDNSLNIPPQGHIAGVYARTDVNRNVGKAPAGTRDGVLNWSIGLERKLEFAEIDTFFQSQVNALMDTPKTGRVVWGGRSLENPPDDFRFVHVRRLFNFLKASIYNSTHGFVFESVGASLRGRIQLSVESFLLGLFYQGIFAGTKPSEGFQVICDETNNPASVEETGEVICDVFVAPNRPGEFIVFRIQQMFTSTTT